MDVPGALQFLDRSEERHGVQYVKYLEDGDSKAFLAVKASKPYGDSTEARKLKCIGHVWERMGTRLRQPKKEKTEKSNGTSLSGRGGLTDAAVYKLQTYYG